MNNSNTDQVNKVKAELKSGLVAIGMALVGGLLLLLAAYFFIMPILSGEEPHTVLALLFAIPGAIIEIIGDWKMMTLKFK